MLSLYFSMSLKPPHSRTFFPRQDCSNTANRNTKTIVVHPTTSSRKLSVSSTSRAGYSLLWYQSTFLALLNNYYLLVNLSPTRMKSLKDKDYVSYLFWHLWCPEQCMACSGNSKNIDSMIKWTALGNMFPSQEASSGADGQLASSSGLGDHSSLLICHVYFPRSYFFCLNVYDISC